MATKIGEGGKAFDLAGLTPHELRVCLAAAELFQALAALPYPGNAGRTQTSHAKLSEVIGVYFREVIEQFKRAGVLPK